MSKGVGTVISSIIMIILILGLAAFFFWLVINLDQKQVEINLREAEVLRTANTFYLTNRSLDMTWFISTVQVIFKAGETALGATYWFNRDIKGELFLYQPGLEELRAYLNENMKSSYTDPVEGSASLSNYVNITVSETAPVFEYIQNPASEDPDTIVSKISEDLQVSYIDTTSKNRLGHRFEIPSFFEAMLRAGNAFVESINEFSANKNAYAYTPAYTSFQNYRDTIKSILDTSIATILPRLGITSIVLARTDLAPYPIVPSIDNGFTIGNPIIQPQGGLILNYIYSARFAENNIVYYYHDEANNVFTKMPFFLDVRANDTVTMINCPAQSNGQIFSFDSSNDLICYRSTARGDNYRELYTCNLRLVGQVPGNQLVSGNCLHHDPSGNGASGLECGSSGFRKCGEKLCWPSSCGEIHCANADCTLGTQDYYLERTCMEQCTEGIGCDCTCPPKKPAGKCTWAQIDHFIAWCAVEDGVPVCKTYSY